MFFNVGTADHRNTASDDTSQDPSQTPLGWKFCTMNMTAFSTQHVAIFELGCRVCGVQETRFTEARQVWAREGRERERNWSIVCGQPLEALRSAWERGQVVLRLLQVQASSCSLSTRESLARHRTLRKSSRRLRKRRPSGARMGMPEQETFTIKMPKNEQLLRERDTHFPSSWPSLAPCPWRFWQTSILHHISVAVRSATDVGSWAACAALDAGASESAPPATCCVHAGLGKRVDVVFANRIGNHALCDARLVGATSIPTHLPVAAVSQFAEYDQIVTTIVRMQKIDSNFWDPEPEAEQLTADRVVAHILGKAKHRLVLGNAATFGSSGSYGARVQKLTCTSE